MAISLHNLSPRKGSKTTKKRVGRGLGSTGTTSGRGQKGQKSRAGSGGYQRIGMKKLLLQTPKLRGFKSAKPKMAVVNLADIAGHFGAGELVTPETLAAKKLISTQKDGVKLLSEGEITVAIKVSGCSVSKVAAEKILAAGGEVIA